MKVVREPPGLVEKEHSNGGERDIVPAYSVVSTGTAGFGSEIYVPMLHPTGYRGRGHAYNDHRPMGRGGDGATGQGIGGTQRVGKSSLRLGKSVVTSKRERRRLQRAGGACSGGDFKGPPAARPQRMESPTPSQQGSRGKATTPMTNVGPVGKDAQGTSGSELNRPATISVTKPYQGDERHNSRASWRFSCSELQSSGSPSLDKVEKPTSRP